MKHIATEVNRRTLPKENIFLTNNETQVRGKHQLPTQTNNVPYQKKRMLIMHESVPHFLSP